jgi:hypothetical protein
MGVLAGTGLYAYIQEGFVAFAHFARLNTRSTEVGGSALTWKYSFGTM